MDEDDLKWETNEKKLSFLLKEIHDFFVLKPLAVWNKIIL